MKWFKHDSDANQDAKLQNVLLDYGLEGYGLYWYCIELIAGKIDKDNISFDLEHDARIIARNVGSTAQRVEEMMRYFVKLGLFENAGGVITCFKIAKRLDKSMTSSNEMRTIIENFKKQDYQRLINTQNHDAVMTQSDNSHDPIMTSHDQVMTESAKPMQDKIRSDQNRKDLKEKYKKEISRFDFSNWPSIPNETIFDDWISMREKMGLAVSQTVITGLGKQMSLAAAGGVTVDYCLTEWVIAEWRRFKAEWVLKPSQNDSAERIMRSSEEYDFSNIRPTTEEDKFKLGASEILQLKNGVIPIRLKNFTNDELTEVRGIYGIAG